MADPVVPSCVRLVPTWQLANGDFAVNVLHFSCNVVPIESGDLFELASFWKTAYDANGRIHVSANDKLVKVRAQNLQAVPYLTADTVYSQAGTAGGSDMPKQLAAVVSIHTGHPGRSGRGRIYHPSLTATALDAAGALTSTYVTDISNYVQDLVDGFVTSTSTAEMKLAVYSRKDGLMYESTGITMDTRADVQRRRANRRVP